MAGAFGLLSTLLSSQDATVNPLKDATINPLKDATVNSPKDGTVSPLSRFCEISNYMIGHFLFWWFIAGNVWIYSIYAPSYDKADNVVSGLYCNKTLCLFAFWTTTLSYIPLALLLIFCQIFCACFTFPFLMRYSVECKNHFTLFSTVGYLDSQRG